MDIVIVEDEHLLAEDLHRKLKSINPKFNVVAKLYSVEEAVEWFGANECELVFMDVHLSDGLSFSIFDQVAVNAPVIFVTAYSHYTLRAFEVNGIAYVLKPVESDDIVKALEKYESLRLSYHKNMDQLLTEGIADSRYKTQMMLTYGQSKMLVDMDSIICFRADGRYVYAATTPERMLLCNHTLRNLEESVLDPHMFFRINRSYIVNRESIAGWRPSGQGRLKVMLNIELSHSLQVSRSRAIEFKKWLQN